MHRTALLRVRPVQAMGGEGSSEGISSALGISAPSGLAETKGEEASERAEGEEAEVTGPEPGEAANLPVSSSETWLQKCLRQRKGDPQLQQAQQPLIFLNPFLTDDLFLLWVFAVTPDTRS